MACVEYPDSGGTAGLRPVVEVVLDQGRDVVGGHQAVARPACVGLEKALFVHYKAVL